MGKEPAKDINPDEAVAIGAALFGNIKENSRSKKVFYDTNSHSIGFLHVKNRQKVNSILIHKNRELPAEETIRTMGTSVKDQKQFILPITEGEALDEEGVIIIDEIKIDLPKGLLAQSKVFIKYVLDEYQLLRVYIDIPSVPDWNFEYKLSQKANLSYEEISNMISEVQDYEVS